MKKLIKFLLSPFLPILYIIRDNKPQFQSLNLIKTFYVNFRVLPFAQARHLPIYIYKNTKIYKLGKITIESKHIYQGMISIGRYDYKARTPGKIHNGGHIIFKGPVLIHGGLVLNNMGTIVFGGYNKISEGCLLNIWDRLELGEHSILGFFSFCMDTDMHFTINCDSKMVARNTKPIIIGRCNWIGNSTYIKKGTITPDYTIVASSNSLLSRDYTSIGEYCVLGGVPAKKIASNIRRIYNIKAERELREYFNNHPEVDSYVIDLGDESVDNFCTSNFL